MPEADLEVNSPLTAEDRNPADHGPAPQLQDGAKELQPVTLFADAPLSVDSDWRPGGRGAKVTTHEKVPVTLNPDGTPAGSSYFNERMPYPKDPTIPAAEVDSESIPQGAAKD